ncbi:MAG: hypothetical protein WAM17_01545 [Rhodoplanes sp.]
MQGEPRPPRASEAKVAYHRKQLLKMFARANDAAFLQMIWAVDALQSGREAVAKPFFSTYPPEAATKSSIPPSPFSIHRWELETLIVQLFLVPKELPREQGNLVLDCSKFESIVETINRLRALENVESARYLSGDFTIWGEMHRIVQRQFHWQRGYLNMPQVYRYAYLYAQGKCAAYFKQTYGYEITDLIFTGLGLFSACLTGPWVRRKTSVPAIGLTDEIVQRAFPMMSCSRDEARIETAALVAKAQDEHGSPIPTALLPSILRKTPLIYVDDPNGLISPIPETILLRVTAGLYHDLFLGGQDIINDANTRFEQYCVDLIDAMMGRFEVSGAFRYGSKGAQFDSPDVLIKDQGQLVIVAECKATKLTYQAQFAEDPFEAAKKQYMQLAKGIFQLWRFFSHVRRGLLEEHLAADCHAVVFTLEPFLQMGRDPQNKVFAEANALADEDGNIAPEDRKLVVICPIYDLEFILSRATEDSLLASLKASNEEKYQRWMLREVHRDTGAAKEFGKPKRYPFDMRNVLPWWTRFDEFNDQEDAADTP